MKLDRRTVLKYGLGGAAVLAAGGVGLGLRATALRTPRRPLQALTEREYSVLAAFADRVCPAGSGFLSATDVEVAEKVDALLATVHPGVRAEIGQALLLFENALAGFLFDRRFQTFTAAPPEVQDQAMEAWRTSKVSVRRTVFKALQGLVAGAYYGSKETYASVGYAGPPNYGNVPVAEGSP